MPAGTDGRARADHRVAGGRARPRLPDDRWTRSYAIGPKRRPRRCGQSRAGRQRRRPRRAGAAAAALLVTPTELHPEAGEPSRLTARAFDAHGVAIAAPRTGDVDARGPEGHDRGRQVHRDAAAGAQAGARQGDGRHDQRDGAHPRDSADCPGASTSRARRTFRRRVGQRDRQVRGAAISTAARCSSS